MHNQGQRCGAAVKAPLAMAASCVRVPVRVLPAPPPIQHLLVHFGRQEMMAQLTGPLQPCGRSQMEFQDLGLEYLFLPLPVILILK